MFAAGIHKPSYSSFVHVYGVVGYDTISYTIQELNTKPV